MRRSLSYASVNSCRSTLLLDFQVMLVVNHHLSADRRPRSAVARDLSYGKMRWQPKCASRTRNGNRAHAKRELRAAASALCGHFDRRSGAELPAAACSCGWSPIRAVEVAFKKPRFLGFLKKPKKPQKSKF